jgi:hypothetical protein
VGLYGPADEPGTIIITMITKTFDILAAATIVLALVFAGFQLFRAAPEALAAISNGPFYSITSASSTQVLTSSKSIAGTSTGLLYREIYNFSGVPIHCAYNDRPAANTTGFFISASSSRVWVGENLYTGAIRCIASATANITVNEVF